LGRGAQQEIEQVAMAAPMCKGSFMVPDVRRIPEFVARAMRLAFSGRRGPVHLRFRSMYRSKRGRRMKSSSPDRKNIALHNRCWPTPAFVRQAIALLRDARRPLAIAGCAAGYTLSGRGFAAASSKPTRVPVVTEEQARGLVSDDHPYVFGFFERGLNRAAAKVRDADVVVLLGRKQDFVIGFCRPPHVSADAKIIQIDPSPLEIGRNRGVAVGIVGDVTSVLEQLSQGSFKSCLE
jgi:thiamine pyrophosphate-dependent acetolactate synthase large subunit-like protein